MRLWHHDLLPYLPRTQLLSQWRELNSIFAKEDKHVLINYIYEYDKLHLYLYTDMVISEMVNRGYNIRSYEKMNTYFSELDKINSIQDNDIFKNHHNKTYLQICYFNLKEKFIRGQKDYTKEQFKALQNYYNSIMKGWLIMSKSFEHELDIALLADTLHSKQCKKFHYPIIDNNCQYACNHYHHNEMLALSNRVSEAQKQTKYYKKAKEVYELCEGMNTNKIIKLIKTIMD